MEEDKKVDEKEEVSLKEKESTSEEIKPNEEKDEINKKYSFPWVYLIIAGVLLLLIIGLSIAVLILKQQG